MTEKDVYYKLDDLEDVACKLDLMIQGYIYSVGQDTNNYRQEEQLRSYSFELSEAITDLKNQFNKEGE